MKTLNLVGVLALVTAAASTFAGGSGTLTFPRQQEPEPAKGPPRVWVDTNYQAPFWEKSPLASSRRDDVFVYEQKLYGGRGSLIPAEQAQGIIERFKAAYPAMGNPRFLIYVNRELVDETAGMKLIKREERLESARNDTNTSAFVRSMDNRTYRADGKSLPTLADKQTVRDVERLFGRPLRAAGASLVDQKIATQLMADKPISDLVGTSDTPQSRKDREAISSIADVVIEILIASKNLTITTLSGEQTIAVPDIQTTAIRVGDSRILALASSSDVTGRITSSSLASFSVPEITEATALALMEDMIPEAK
jgi:hypothetical protein